MFINLSYSQLLAISSALNVVDTVYGASDDVAALIDVINDAINVMDDFPVTKVYPGIEEVISNV